MLQRKLFFFSSMESSSSLSFLSQQMPPPVTSRTIIFSSISSCWKQKRPSIQISAVSYRKFIHFALDETKRHTHLAPSPLQERFNSIISMDGEVELQMTSFEAPKIRLLRSLSIETETMQVLDFGVFPKPEYDVPIFCANFFTSGNTNIILLDLNPLHDVINQREYKEKYYKSLMPLGVKYAELLPWGGKLTSESLKFFSPIVLWTKFASSEYKHDVLFSAFMDYYKAWLHLMEGAVEETDPSGIKCNREAQHRYLTWRAEKDPGHRVLQKLIGETQTKDLLRNFLFHGIVQLGSKNFLDYFPEYRCEDGTINERRTIIGKSFESRPWDTRGEFIGSFF
ncbi:phytochromobilin:ferredoxin oxidoreductase, chloroplastic isoform X1 [Ziziphus jujuba]|uniref:Phytochromobilin:ferredoxin oxidoreductase, chloroplastic isoform X1 n=1 Tax=Ziziphus jujuba TaxID=326968 RepID=A0A6P3Z256_ZIZJJ|nr:phytochromobilin:ferredoxin oxidoreductase, chloroplastic isoform X1 [Ziziphus jujuba]